MAGADTFTPNLHLTKIGGDRKNWNDIANGNMTLLDAVISAFFTVSNMRGIWENSTIYAVGDGVVDPDTAVVWVNNFAHTSAMLPTTFVEARTANPTYWSIYAAAATAKGAWLPNTAYSRNDFVLADGNKYAFCLVAHTSGASFAADLALGFWSVIIDLSTAGSLVLPTLTPIVDANKVVVTNSDGSAYVIATAGEARVVIGATTIGDALITAVSQAAARTAILAQALDATLTALSGQPTDTYGVSLLDLANPGVLIYNYINGYGTVRASTTTITVNPGSCTNSTNASMIPLTAAITKSTAGSWLAGSGNNGMGQGLVIANNTWYHVFAITVNGATDVYFDTSTTAANAPASTSAFRRIGSFLTNGTAQILDYVQYGDDFFWVAVTSTTVAAATNPVALVVPLGVNTTWLGNIEIVCGAGVNCTYTLRDVGSTSGGETVGVGAGGTATTVRKTVPVEVRVGTAGTVATATSGTHAANPNLFHRGWRDSRGKNA